ncbi:acyltransferase family protein [Pontixanthobacter aestiaquae]|uniref:Acyltransferase family protein n=1 Tax=Pontixanthobacter aestiaquae TaxID=1509367 RepID=A0A844Z541_9SPHN|nr:acyltransferase family protein [Pontixanthobacter aestiaquae]MDN3646150.1 acyltransferase family protein [Pontixanthobacter aestiaquae]MXO82858.1 acyltransferase family protein [Pontixanthobacter aestiaquae]
MVAPAAFSYRPEIDGLRAVAVVAVILYHAGYSLFSGGFVGVDVFFVISGYLICSLILKDLDRGTFSFLEFWERRARRIFPALFAMVLGTVLIGLVLLFPGDIQRLGSSMAGVATFLSNIVFSRQTGYFDAVSEFKPLIHTWSLSVEEQFYLVFPVLIFLLWKLGARKASAVFAGLLIASLAAAELTVRASPDVAFFYPHTRAWELLSGVLAAIFLHRAPANWSASTREIGSMAGFALVFGSIFWLDSTTPFPSLYAVPPVLGTVMIVLFARDGGIVRSALAWKPMVAIGLASYSAYLWHQPVFAYARHLYIADPLGIMMPIAIVISAALAYLSWRFIEAPFRDRSRFSQKQIFAGSLGALAVTFIIGVGLYFSDGLEGRFSPEVRELIAKKAYSRGLTGKCVISEREPDILRAKIAACYERGNTIYLIGDSHARSISQAVGKLADSNNMKLIVLWESGCMPVQTVGRTRQSETCTDLKAQTRQLTHDFPAPVILSSRWRGFIQGNPFNNREGGQEFGRSMPMVADGELVNNPVERVETALRDWSKDVPLVIVDMIPEAGWLVKHAMARRRQMGIGPDDPLTTSYDAYLDANRDIITMFDRLEQNEAISVVRTAPMVCSEQSGRCLNERNGEALYIDDHHPDWAFSQDIAAGVFEQLHGRKLVAAPDKNDR